MEINGYDYSLISSAAAAQNVRQVQQTPIAEENQSKVQELKEVDSYVHDESPDLAAAGIYNAQGRLAATANSEAQNESKNSTDEEPDESHFTVKIQPSKTQQAGGAAPTTTTTSSDDDDDSEDSTTTKMVVINGVMYSETTTIKDGVKTVTRTALDTGETTTTTTKVA